MKMGDLELSLDDIIKKKFKNTGIKRGRNSTGNIKKPVRISDPVNRIRKNQNVKNVKTLMKTARGQAPKPNIGDARLKIIQKQRQKLKDAREKLGQIAKQTDARVRLVKLRERQQGALSTGGISARPELLLLQRTVQSTLNNSLYDAEPVDYTDDLFLKRNFQTEAYNDVYSGTLRSRTNAPVLFRTVENDLPINRLHEEEEDFYLWTNPLYKKDVIDIPIARGNAGVTVGLGSSDDRRDVKSNTSIWDVDEPPIVITKNIKPQETVGILKRSSSGNYYDSQAVKIVRESSPTKSKAPARTLSERFCQDGNLSAQKINLLKAKLEMSQKNKKTLSESQPPLGHRIVVSNLVPSVTHEDVKELFEDIGELISSKVVRPGTAEVVYKLQKDAVKAVDVYHNRQLDGQPMKCLLVNNRSAFPTNSKLYKGVERKIGKAVVEVDMTAFRKALHKKTTS